MNFVVIGLISLVALIVIVLLLSKWLGFGALWASATSEQEAAEQKRRNQILKG